MNAAWSSARKRCVVAVVLVGTIGLHCSSFDAVAQRLPAFPAEPPANLARIGIGPIVGLGASTAGPGNAIRTLGGSLAFALREQGFVVQEPADVGRILKRVQLPSDRLLSEEELVRLSGRLAPRLFVQGEFQERLTYDLVDEYLQVTVNLYVYDMASGRKIADVRVFGNDLKRYSGPESLEAARLLSRRLKGLLVLGAAGPSGKGK